MWGGGGGGELLLSVLLSFSVFMLTFNSESRTQSFKFQSSCRLTLLIDAVNVLE